MEKLDERNTVLYDYLSEKTGKKISSLEAVRLLYDTLNTQSKDELIRNTKLWVYSVHDDTIANMLNTLGVFEPHCPPSAATLLVELRIKAQNEFIVTVFYKNSTEHLTLLTLPGCTAACPLNEFVRLMNVKNIIPGDWEQECSLEHGQYIFEKGDGIGIITILVCFLFSMLLYLPLFCAMYQKWRLYKKI